MIPLIGLLIKDAHFGIRHLSSVCKRLKAKDPYRLINEYKRLVEDSNTENQGFDKFGKVALIGELRI